MELGKSRQSSNKNLIIKDLDLVYMSTFDLGREVNPRLLIPDFQKISLVKGVLSEAEEKTWPERPKGDKRLYAFAGIDKSTYDYEFVRKGKFIRLELEPLWVILPGLSDFAHVEVFLSIYEIGIGALSFWLCFEDESLSVQELINLENVWNIYHSEAKVRLSSYCAEYLFGFFPSARVELQKDQSQITLKQSFGRIFYYCYVVPVLEVILGKDLRRRGVEENREFLAREIAESIRYPGWSAYSVVSIRKTAPMYRTIRKLIEDHPRETYSLIRREVPPEYVKDEDLVRYINSKIQNGYMFCTMPTHLLVIDLNNRDERRFLEMKIRTLVVVEILRVKRRIIRLLEYLLSDYEATFLERDIGYLANLRDFVWKGIEEYHNLKTSAYSVYFDEYLKGLDAMGISELYELMSRRFDYLDRRVMSTHIVALATKEARRIVEILSLVLGSLVIAEIASNFATWYFRPIKMPSAIWWTAVSFLVVLTIVMAVYITVTRKR